MAILSIPDQQITITDPKEILAFFQARSIFFDQWSCDVNFLDTATAEEILDAYRKDLDPFMRAGGYQTADVISINRLTENYDAIRAKFLAEHTHSEDEIRFFVDGQGLFWFHLEGEPVFNLLCERGDLISVPAGTKHWFDAGPTPFVKAIRIFIDQSGWVPNYTDSKIETSFSDFEVALRHPIKHVVTDIEGTTSSVDFVYDVLFPYFREHLHELKDLSNRDDVAHAFNKTIELAFTEDGERIVSKDEIIEKLRQWSVEDRKITPLKAVQGILWEKGYQEGTIRGHVYPEVAASLEQWLKNGIQLSVFSSGSIKAQKLLFGYSEAGDLTPYFSNYFDTTTGQKRDMHTYERIAKELGASPESIVFLSDIVEELDAARQAGYQTVQLVRPGNTPKWNRTAQNFDEVTALMETTSN